MKYNIVNNEKSEDFNRAEQTKDPERWNIEIEGTGNSMFEMPTEWRTHTWEQGRHISSQKTEGLSGGNTLIQC